MPTRTYKTVSLKLTQPFKEKLLYWAQQFREVVWLDSNFYPQNHTSFDAILAVDAITSLQTHYEGAFNALEEYQTITKDWLFGYLSYDLKNDIENLQSQNTDGLQFPDLFFFQPKKILSFKENKLTFHYLPLVEDEINEDLRVINQQKVPSIKNANALKISARTTKQNYYNKVQQILQHIQRGDIYEANFCQEFFAKETPINPLETYLRLNEISRPPFATFLKVAHRYLLSASPERFLKKEGNTLVSQPIKGTSKRSNSKSEDQKIKDTLLQNKKEISENIMITDLVRNDLSKFALKNSVNVEELCKLYTFKQVHQLVSTITCKLPEHLSPVKMIKNMFPMGSMTGAPKISAMQIIEQFEDAKRGIYSGAVGYFTPENDFDFNVVIRSILHNKNTQYTSFTVGGAITTQSDPKLEYDECFVKAKALFKVLTN